MDITSYILGKKAGGGSAPVLQDKEVEITQNGETTITADSGYDGLSSVDITTNVPSRKFAFPNVGGFIFANFSYPYMGDVQTEINYIIQNVDTSSITTMEAMFSQCKGVQSIDLSNFNTSNVMSMRSTFANCTSLTSLNVANLDVSNVLYMGSMFQNCKSLTTIDLSTWHNSKVTETANMFSFCTSLRHLDIRNFDFTNDTSYASMFGSASNNYVPANCLIIVKDNTQKQWITSKFSRLTNVKTVAEYEGS